MVKLIFRTNLISLLLIGFYVCLCSCKPPTTTTPPPPPEVAQPESPTGIDDYIDNISAHYKNEIQRLEADITRMESAFSKQISTVAFTQELAAKIARQVESRIRGTKSLNPNGKYCMQDYLANVTAQNTALQASLRACADTASKDGNTLSKTAKAQAENATQQLSDLVGKDMPDCRKTNAKDEQKLEECVWGKLKVRELNIRNCLNKGDTEIEGAACQADIIAQNAQECSFTHLLKTQALISEILTNVNMCIGVKVLELN